QAGAAEQPDAGQPDGDTGQRDRSERGSIAEDVGGDGSNDRYAGDQEAGEPGRQVLLGVGEQQPWQGHLEGGEGEQRSPVRQGGADGAGPRREQEVWHGGEGRPP